MIDLPAAPVPELSEEWIAGHRDALVDALSERRRRPTRWMAVAGATGVAATVSSVLVVGGGEPAAFAGWSADPTPPASGQVAAANATCEARLAESAQSQPSNKGPAPGAAAFVPELVDVRGPYTVTVLGDGGPGAALCIAASNATSLRWVTTSGAAPSPGTIAVDQVSVLQRDGQPYTLVEGRISSGVTAVSLTLGDGSQVTATSGDGLFVAWWPGSQNVTTAVVTSPNGSSTQELNLPGARIPADTKMPPATSGA